jgi:Cu-processing system permease protein
MRHGMHTMIEIQDVSKRYGRRAALSGVTLRIPSGEVTLLLGANGAGKSTLLRCMLGITDFTGDIRVNGLDPVRDGSAVRALVGYMPQRGGLHEDLTVQETIDFHTAIRRASPDRATALLAEAGLSAHTHSKVGELSGGLLQRLGFALALLTDPPILVLDEPSASLDAASRRWLVERLRDLAAAGHTIIVSTHADHELAAGDRQFVLEDGHVAATGAGGQEGVLVSPCSQRAPDAGVAPASTATATPIVWKELRDAVRNRWLIGYAVVLGLLGLVAAGTAVQSSAGLALQAFGRTTATLMNLCLLLAPLVAVSMGAASISGERDRGTLEYLLAQPFTRTRLLLGKYAGLLVSLMAATLLGFLPAGILAATSFGGGVLGHYLLFPAIAMLVGAAMLGVGMLISVSSRTAVQSQGTALFVWFAFVLLYDLLLMGALALGGLRVEVLSACLVGNPVDAARVLGVLALEPDLYLLGPAGAYLAARFSRSGAAILLLSALWVWATVPLLAAVVRFRLRRRTVRTRIGFLPEKKAIVSSSC